MIIGCGGVASVAIHKCCQNSEIFEEIMIASRTKAKCDALKEKLEGTTKTVIHTAQVDADHVDELVALIQEFKPDVVLNLALPYQDLTMLILRTMNLWILQSLSINGNGHIVKNSRKRVFVLSWVVDLTLV